MKKFLINMWQSDNMMPFKFFFVAFPLMIGIQKCNRHFSGPDKIVKTTIKVFYTNGTNEIIQLKRKQKVIYKHALYNGCIYRDKINANTIFDETKYNDAIRCGVKYYKTISIKVY